MLHDKLLKDVRRTNTVSCLTTLWVIKSLISYLTTNLNKSNIKSIKSYLLTNINKSIYKKLFLLDPINPFVFFKFLKKFIRNKINLNLLNSN